MLFNHYLHICACVRSRLCIVLIANRQKIRSIHAAVKLEGTNKVLLLELVLIAMTFYISFLQFTMLL